jgi:hypothetical protein
MMDTFVSSFLRWQNVVLGVSNGTLVTKLIKVDDDMMVRDRDTR